MHSTRKEDTDFRIIHLTYSFFMPLSEHGEQILVTDSD